MNFLNVDMILLAISIDLNSNLINIFINRYKKTKDKLGGVHEVERRRGKGNTRNFVFRIR